jgi:aminoglycoside 3-N-acetyltransferase I
MARVFGEPHVEVGEDYLARLLSDDRFWAIAALSEGELVGGVTAHTLPMTRSESHELFVYDIAVLPDHQRHGIGRTLMRSLRAEAAHVGIMNVFVAAATEDAHALDFYRALGGAASSVTMYTFTDPNTRSSC